MVEALALQELGVVTAMKIDINIYSNLLNYQPVHF